MMRHEITVKVKTTSMPQPHEPNYFGEDVAEKFPNEGNGEPRLPNATEGGEGRSEKYLPCSDVDDAAEEEDIQSEGNLWVLENANLPKCAFNVFKANVASGVFLLPTFYKDSGYIMSPIFSLLIGAIVVDCSRLLVRAKTKVNRGSVSDYAQLCDFVLGKPFRYILFVALLLTQYAFLLALPAAFCRCHGKNCASVFRKCVCLDNRYVCHCFAYDFFKREPGVPCGCSHCFHCICGFCASCYDDCVIY
ncbi:solute carrier family 36 (proton-coupled amino acid transporter) [Trypanosoma rangeli]|uniref:Solute carrier family 36 (Proton-coupled amino acid transporter) n=1 Tax=Trypanosoma rangeli TaxID=5698 RepID=A0A3R7MG40_TRYRA|nr:solute carrier family 36 (proton-coupled amino acid transporter) [Trypanosoma rangeli]RNF01890.1 solute carrier family 36 (proton-coupled amino acid transporter) [Trypanosoma rangeli]|eukprot:RNF01890.1 solute carrier family 36 (proton-coupled amino acid transporter) [Trypanosoma rangeli]